MSKSQKFARHCWCSANLYLNVVTYTSIAMHIFGCHYEIYRAKFYFIKFGIVPKLSQFRNLTQNSGTEHIWRRDGRMLDLDALSNAWHTWCSHSLRTHGCKQEVAKPLFFLPTCATKEVKRSGRMVGLLVGALLGTGWFTFWFLGPTPLWYPHLAVEFMCQLDADGILWVPCSLPSQHRGEQEDLQ